MKKNLNGKFCKVERLFEEFFGDSRRRIQIMLFWHLRQPVKGDTVREVLGRFIETVLYAPIYFVVTNKLVMFFRGEHGLALPYEFMTFAERKIMKKIYPDRYFLFDQVDRYQTNRSWRLSEYRGDPQVLWPEKRRRAMVREFVQFLFCRDFKLKPALRVELIIVTQYLIEDRGHRGDRFIQSLHDKLQNIGDINNWMLSEV